MRRIWLHHSIYLRQSSIQFAIGFRPRRVAFGHSGNVGRVCRRTAHPVVGTIRPRAGEITVAAMRVSYSKGRTLNMGQFESLRVDVGIELECADGEEEATFERLKNWVNQRLAKEVSNRG